MLGNIRAFLSAQAPRNTNTSRPTRANPGTPSARSTIVVDFDPQELGWLQASAANNEARLVAHTGWAHEVAGFVLKLESRAYHELGHYLAEDGFAGELEGVLVGYIRTFKVSAALRGQGIGGEMLEASLAAMRRAGIQRVFLHASPERARMGDLLRFYETHGFKEFDEVSDGYPILEMDLSSA